MERPDSSAADSIEPGQRVFDDDGELLGRVSGYTDDGFEVETPSGDSSDPASEEVPGQGFGEGYLMWECTECGEMGEIEDGLPENCPNCGAPREAIAEARED
ncbi:DUF7130 family rubredoxin-like protein [Salinarchaeum laminariae]|uniref:DUF7130 family rubredoxin-like protein n=1 Tax=Salinarchaeum laminariae TaxID=869888 RepID=UPI0020C06821|nr:hypothetical protein [Salinarchaeum laminariae]